MRGKCAPGGWRRGRDSNPRDACAPAGFQDRCLQPLGHPSNIQLAGILESEARKSNGVETQSDSTCLKITSTTAVTHRPSAKARRWRELTTAGPYPDVRPPRPPN